MRDCSKNRAGYDRVLMAVAATFLAVSATSALAAGRSAPQQRRGTRDRRSDPASRTGQRSAADRRRFQARHHRVGARSGQDGSARTAARLQPSRSEAGRNRNRARRIARASRHRRRRPPQHPLPPAPAAPRHRRRAGQGREHVSRRRISRSPTNCATCWAAKALRYFDRKGERAAVEKFYSAREYAPLWTQSRHADRQRQGRHRAAQGCRLRRPQRRRLSGAGFRRRDHARRSWPMPN